MKTSMPKIIFTNLITTRTPLRFNVLATIEKEPTVTLTLESTNTILTILVSLSILLGVGVQLIFKFSKINSDIKDLKDDLKNHANTEGHDKLIERVKVLQKEFSENDKLFGIHLQNFQNRAETVQFLFGQLNEKIDHKSKRWEDEIKEVEVEVKEVQQFLHKNQSFVIRNNEK